VSDQDVPFSLGGQCAIAGFKNSLSLRGVGIAPIDIEKMNDFAVEGRKQVFGETGLQAKGSRIDRCIQGGKNAQYPFIRRSSDVFLLL
jgi:hypothetical protein